VKQRKIFRIVSASLALMLAAASAGACSKNPCTHAFRYTVKTPATCVAEGEREGLCGICGHFITESIPVDENAHAYGAWEVSEPTAGQTGLAVKTCEYSAQHKLEQTLPVLGAQDYKVKVLSSPTAFNKGETQYTLAHEAGDIVFTVETAETGIQTVSDAIGAALANKGQVRKGTGGYVSDKNRYEIDAISYEFGNRYAHIIDEGMGWEHWYSWEEDGEFYGVRFDKHLGEEGGDGKLTIEAHPNGDGTYREEPYLDGFCYEIPWAGDDFGSYYGAENLADGLQRFIKKNNNRDYKERIEEKNGKTYYGYSYSYLAADTYFCFLDLEFTLSDTFALKDLEFNCKIYPKGSWQHNEEDGTTVLTNPDSVFFHSFIEYHQTLVSELSPEEAADVPTNPYGMGSRSVQSFKLIYRGEEVSETSIPQIPTSFSFNLSVTDVQPVLADMTLDPIVNFYRVLNGRDLPLDGLTETTTGFMIYYNESKLSIRSWVAGKVTFAVETKSHYRKVFTIDFQPVAPTSLTASAYEVGVQGSAWNNTVVRTTIYTGQPLYLRALASEQEQNYADPSFTVSAMLGDTAASGVTFTKETFDGKNVARMIASQTGEYTVTLTSALNSSVKAALVVTVVQAPTPAQMFQGVYEANVTEATLRGTVRLEFNPSADPKSGTIRLTYPNFNEQIFNYSYTENADPVLAGTLTTTHQSGANDYEARITLNDAYLFELTYKTKFGEWNTVRFAPFND